MDIRNYVGENIRIKLNQKLNQKQVMLFELVFFGVFIVLLMIYTLFMQKYSWIGDAIITSFIILFFYMVRNVLKITPLLFSILIFAMMIHNLGVFGFYSEEFFGLTFDHYTHFLGNFALSLIFFNWFCSFSNMKNKIISLCILTMFFTLGIGAMHETIEFLGYVYLEADFANMLYPGNAPLALLAQNEINNSMDYFNTMIDIIYNAVGALAGCVVMSTTILLKSDFSTSVFTGGQVEKSGLKKTDPSRRARMPPVYSHGH